MKKKTHMIIKNKQNDLKIFIKTFIIKIKTKKLKSHIFLLVIKD